MCKLGSIAAVALVCGVGVAQATDYTVPTDGTLDEVIGMAKKGDNIYVEKGTYTTSTQYGPNVLGNLIGTGATRDDVIIQSSGSYRTLRLADGGRIENVTIVGEGTYKADKGGAVEVNGGTITNCVITGGTAYGNDSNNAGGNLYVDANGALVVDCLIKDGKTKNRGGNVCLDHGTVRNCTIIGGSIPEKRNDKAEQFGGNVFMYQGTLEGCTVTGGSAERAGNVYVHNSVSVVKDCTISGGTVSNYGGNVFLRDGKIQDSNLSESSATNNGGSVYMQAGSIEGCSISKGSGKEGGAIYMTGGTLKDSTVYANGTTKGSGCGVYMDGSGATIDGCTIDGKDGVLSYHGGCIYMKSGTVKNTTCQNGVARSGGDRSGGNIYMENGTLMTVTLRNGDAISQGGNLFVKNGTVTGLVCENGKAGSNGGNIRANGSVVISDSIIKDGSGVSDGEAKGANVYMDATAKLIRCQVLGGTSYKLDGMTVGYDRGSICAYSSDAVIDNCLVAGSACGGILLGTGAKVYNTTIVNNEKYGVWCWGGGGQTFQNCVLFGNKAGDAARDWTGDQPSAVERLLNCAVPTGTVADRYTTTVTITADDFMDYAAGDYRPAGESSALFNAGAADERSDASALDLAGKPRRSESIDVGCYEYQISAMTVALTAPELDRGYAPATVTLMASAENAPAGETVTYVVDFGDGTTVETTDPALSHTYATSGSFTISAIAKAGEDRSRKAAERQVALVEKVQRVGGTGHATVAEAVAASVDGCEIILEGDRYDVTATIVVNKAVTLKPQGDGKVTFRAAGTGYRVMELSNGARAENLIVENGSLLGGFGACLSVENATAANCIIRGGTVTRGESGNVGGGGVVLYASGELTHCVVTGNTVVGTSTDKGDFGGAVYIPNGRQYVKVLNTLVADNVYETSEGVEAKSGAAGICFGGGNEHSLVENCTIAGNTVRGALSTDSAGIYCTSWTMTFRNNVVAGNLETAEGENGTYTATHIETHCTTRCVVTDAAAPINDYCFVATRDRIFRNFARKDYRPLSKGALFDKGETTSSVDMNGTDLLGNPRVMFEAIDVGCYEAQSKGGFTVIVK